MDQLFSLFPIERVARSWDRGGISDEDFDESLLPFEITEDVWIEDISARISDQEFEVYKSMLGTETVKHLERLKYVIIHRFERTYVGEATNQLVFEQEQVAHSTQLVQEVVACLRLIRPTVQFAQFCGGTVSKDGNLTLFHFDNPLTFFTPLQNQRLFAVRTSDIQNLKVYAPLFRKAFAGSFWKFRMAVDMFQSGYFQQSHWKARYFLWTAALESLFTTQGFKGQHSGSVVAKERIKFLLGPSASIYPPGELTKLDPNTPLTIADVIDEIYCLRNHIAHGDKLPDYYHQSVGRESFEGTKLSRVDMLLEALSSIIRQCLLTILKKNLLTHFESADSSRSYFTTYGLTKKKIEEKDESWKYSCPK